MLNMHLELAEMDPEQYGTTKAVEVERLRQKSMSEILKVAEDNLRSPLNGSGEDSKVTAEHSVEGELDLSDPNAAYFRIVEQWKQSTK